MIDKRSPTSAGRKGTIARAIITARHGEDIYPLGRFVLDRAQTLLMARGELVRRLGYRNTHRGHIALSRALTSGTVPAQMSNCLADALAVPRDLVEAVIAATEAQRQDEFRARRLGHERDYAASFRPYLRAEPSKVVPEPMFPALLIGVDRLVRVEIADAAWDAPDDERNRLIRPAIRKHYERCQGEIPTFGPIHCYTAVTLAGYGVDLGWSYDITGEPAGPMRPVKRLVQGTLSTKRGDTRLTGLLREIPITERLAYQGKFINERP